VPLPAVSAAPPTWSAYRVALVRRDDVLNVRSGPSAATPVIGYIPPAGRGIRLLGPCTGAWCPVAHGALTGWVNRAYLEPEPRLVSRGR
jgi:uncharacterized protein YraI